MSKKIALISLPILLLATGLVFGRSLRRQKTAVLVQTTPTATPEPITNFLPVEEEVLQNPDKSWSDPDGFLLSYPARANAIHSGGQTTISEDNELFHYRLGFCKTCSLPKCQGDCRQKSTVVIPLKKEELQAKDYAFDYNGNHFFITKVLYPSNNREEYLHLWGWYRSREDLQRLTAITRTFRFTADYKISPQQAITAVRNTNTVRELDRATADEIDLQMMYEDEAKNSWVIGLYLTNEDGNKLFVNQFFVEKYSGEITALFSSPTPLPR